MNPPSLGTFAQCLLSGVPLVGMYLILSREPVLMTLRMLTESAARSSPHTAHPLPIAREGRRTKSPTLGQLISKPRLSPRKQLMLCKYYLVSPRRYLTSHLLLVCARWGHLASMLKRHILISLASRRPSRPCTSMPLADAEDIRQRPKAPRPWACKSERSVPTNSRVRLPHLTMPLPPGLKGDLSGGCTE
ncbi:hypothetical protein HDV57DRAFT_401225 [Trichoderma longibrachiatum]